MEQLNVALSENMTFVLITCVSSLIVAYTNTDFQASGCFSHKSMHTFKNKLNSWKRNRKESLTLSCARMTAKI